MRRTVLGSLGALALLGCGPTLPFSPDESGPTHKEPDSLGSDGDVTRVEVSGIVNAPPREPRTIAALMFDIGGGPPDADEIQELLTGENSLRQMYREISYGMQDLTIELFGPYVLDQETCLPIECCGPKDDQPNGPQVQDIIAALPSTYDHYFWVYGEIPPDAECGTWGDEGRPGDYATYSSYSFHGIVGYSQELGHNFGMTHEPIMTCPGMATFVDDPSQCTHSEYGSQLSFMGSGPMHVSGYHKVAQGWLSACNGVTVGGSGTYTLLPTEIPCDGTQILQIPAPKSRSAPMAGDRQGRAPMLTHYYLELRTPRSFDARYMTPQVFISIGPDFNLTQSAPYVYQLNRTPDNNNRPSLADGGYTTGDTFEDPAGGLTFMFDSVTNDQAIITITSTAQGGDTCLDDTAFTAPGPGPESCGLPIPPTGGAAGVGGMAGAGASGAGAGGVAGTTSGAGAGGQSAGAGGAPGGMGGVAGTTPTAGTGGTSMGNAGAPTAGAPSGAGGGAGQAAGAAGMGPPTAGQGPLGPAEDATEVTGGCGCRVAGAPRSTSVLLLALAGVFARMARRRRASAFSR